VGFINPRSQVQLLPPAHFDTLSVNILTAEFHREHFLLKSIPRRKIYMKVKVLQFENYMGAIKKSVGSEIFQTIWGEVDGERKDLTSPQNKGQVSCAVHVSSILLWFTEFGLLGKRHVGMAGLLRDMKESGWYEIDELKVGAVIHWENWTRRGISNDHIGFYIGDEKAVNNDPDKGVPVVRHYTYGEKNGKPVRKIEAIYWHSRLDNKYFE
jgi:hypothetical protein